MGEIQYFNVSIGDASQATSGIRGHFYEENLPASIRCKLTNNILDESNMNEIVEEPFSVGYLPEDEYENPNDPHGFGKWW